MPIRKVKGGYKWGSKGPFESYDKTLSVQKAAYAHGYKGNPNNLAYEGQIYKGELS